MDRTAVRIINILLGNPENEPVLEIHFPAPELVFEEPAAFAIGGAEMGPLLNDKPLGNWRVYKAAAGDVLRFSGLTSGARSYLSVKGGFSADRWLGSRSTNLAAKMGGFRGRVLRKDDRIEYCGGKEVARLSPLWASPRILPPYSGSPTVRFIRGNEFALLPVESQRLLVSEPFAISMNADRMGYRLNGPPIDSNGLPEMISSAVDFGTVQLLPDGSLIILMAEHQTSGGYPRLGHVISVDLPLLAQLNPGNKIEFLEVSIRDAEELRMDLEKNLNCLSTGVRLHRISTES